MDGSQPDGVAQERVDQLIGALGSERHRLRVARHDYAVVDRSRFARLRSTWLLFKHALGFGGARDRFATVSVPELAFLAAAPPAPPVLLETGRELAPPPRPVRMHDSYERWRAANDPRPADLERMRECAEALAYRPLISIIMPTYETPAELLLDAIGSVRDQVYARWELCVADDASRAPHVRRILDDAAARDERIRVVYRTENGHISQASNSALAIARGEFVALLDHDDLLSPEALFENVVLLNRHPDTDMIYSDEDKCDESGRRRDPFFKPDWSPETLLSKMYTSHLGVYRRSIVERIGGFRSEFDGSQDYDLVLRFTEHTDRIHHIPRVLYHWRIHAGSAAGGTAAKPYAYVAAQKALTEALERRGEPAEVRHLAGYPGHYVPRFEIVAPRKVAIVVPTRDRAELLDRALRSVVEVTTYRDWEIAVVDNGSVEAATQQLLDGYAAELGPRFAVVRVDEPFNFSRLVNAGVAATDAPYVVLLNNDTQVVTPDWIEAMMEQCQRPRIGAVGIKLLYPDGRLQHGGVILGLGGVAGHGHHGEPGDSPGYYGALVCLNNYSAVTAACLMVRRDAYLEVGGFDEDLAVAYNDIDFCLKLAARGYRNVYVPHVTVMHEESASRGSDLSAQNETRNLMEQAIVLTRWGGRNPARSVLQPAFELAPFVVHDRRAGMTSGVRAAQLTVRSVTTTAGRRLRALAIRALPLATPRVAEVAALAGVIAAALILALAWTRLVPIFESPDEAAHFDYALSLAHAGRLMSPLEGPAGLADPDVRYLAAKVDLKRIPFRPLQRVAPGYGTAQFYRDVDAHAPAVGDYFRRPRHTVPELLLLYPFAFYALEAVVIRAAAPFTGLTGQFFAARALCVALLGAGLVFSYLTMRELRFSIERALLITAILGLLPLATFVGSYVQPDDLAFAAACAAFWAALRYKRRPELARWPIVLGLVIGVLAVTKLHTFAAVAVPVVGLCATQRFRLAPAKRRWAHLVLSLALPALVLLAVQYGYVQPVWAHARSLTPVILHNDALSAAYRSHGIAGAAPLLAGGTAAALNDFFAADGVTAVSFWGTFGWMDTALTIVDPTVEAAVRKVIQVVTLCCIVAVVVVVAGHLRDVVSIALRGRPASAARLLFADPLTASYLLFGAALFSLYVLTANAYGAQGRDWIAMLLPIVLVAVDVAPRALGRLRLARTAGAFTTVLLALYAVAGSHYAYADVYDRYYLADQTGAHLRGLGARWDGGVAAGSIDEVRDERRADDELHAADPIAVRGWAVDRNHETIARAVDVVVDGRRAFPATYGAARQDVVNVLHGAYLDSGFDVVLPPGALEPGAHRVDLRVVTQDLVYYERLPAPRRVVVQP